MQRPSFGHRSPAPPAGEVDKPTPTRVSPQLGTSMIPRGRRAKLRGQIRGLSRHRHEGTASIGSQARQAVQLLVPTVVLALLVTLGLVAFFVAPTHRGPMPEALIAMMIAVSPPLTFGASRRLGLSLIGGLVAATVAACVLPTASSDVVGAPEHVAVVAGLTAVALWPFNLTGTVRRYACGLLSGIAIAASPIAIIAMAAAIYWIMREKEDRLRRSRALRGPVVLGSAVGALGIVILTVSGIDLSASTWAGGVVLATIVISVAPALGFLAGVGADAALLAATNPEADTKTRFVGVIGGLAIGLLIAAAFGGAVAQIRDRSYVVDVEGVRPAALAPYVTDAG